MTTILLATQNYERWLKSQIKIIQKDLKHKHSEMRKGAFPFLRATFYRWAEAFPEICERLMHAPTVLGVGDLHVENFGTWRDVEGRLVWGINDFDEACRLPYTSDLVRLATSVFVASADHDLGIHPSQVCQEILHGYQEGLSAQGSPFVLSEHHSVLRDLAVHRLKKPEEFWQKLASVPSISHPAPPAVIKAMQRQIPGKRLKLRVVHRIAGLGSLGRRRYAALTEFQGAALAREAKELAVSAWHWLHGGSKKILYQRMLDTAIRTEDPFLRVKDCWVIRRLAPDCWRIELASLPSPKDVVLLLQCMGWETANIHLGSAARGQVLADLTLRRPTWLEDAARKMTDSVTADFRAWKKSVARS